jgi:hypothetical protein
MSFQDVSNTRRTARLTRQQEMQCHSRSERLAQTSPERAIRVRGVSSSRQQPLRNQQSEILGPDEKSNEASASSPDDLQLKGRRRGPPSSAVPSLLAIASMSSTFSSQEEDGDALRKIRSRMQQRSEFAQLVTDIRHFQTLVKDLETTLQTQDTAMSPEAAWRARILWTSAVETDAALTQRLMEYERSSRVRDDDGSIRRLVAGGDDDDVTKKTKPKVRTSTAAQSACVKLHRDVQRTHRSLQALLAKHRQTQAFDIQAQLGSVGWSAQQVELPAHEIRKMNETMHQVNDLVQELAGMVATQQDPIDRLEDNMQHAHDTVESGRRQLSCARAVAMEDPRDLFMCGEQPTSTDTPTNEEETYHHRVESLLVCGPDLDVVAGRRPGTQGYDRNISLHDDVDKDDGQCNDSTACDWRSQWENLKDGVLGLKDDLILASQDLQRMASSSVSSTAEPSLTGAVDNGVRTREDGQQYKS